MSKAEYPVVVIVALTALATSSVADVLKLKSGPAVQGTIVSANSREIVFLGMDGSSQAYPIAAVSGIDFAQLPVATASAPARASSAVMTIPAGTQVAVRTTDAIDGKTAKAGMRYRASIDEPVTVGSKQAIPKGASCTLEIISVDSGDEMAIRLRDVNVQGKTYGLSTEYAQVEAQGTSKKKKGFRRGVGLGAAGAGIGALAGGGEGAIIGAAIGAGVGAISGAAAKGKELNLPAESRLIFSLTAPVPMN
jgi:hypothetical protein